MRTWQPASIAQARPLGVEDIATQITLDEALAELRAAVSEPAALADLPTPPSGPFRELSHDEIRDLERQGCSAADWSAVLVGPKFNPRAVRGCRFIGSVRLGAFEGTAKALGGVELPTGLCDCLIANSTISDDALVMRVGALVNYVVGVGAVILDCAEVVCEPGSAFGNGLDICVGIETGGREVASYAELTIPVADCVAKRRDARDFLAEYSSLVDTYAAKMRSGLGAVGDGTRLTHTPRVRNAVIGPHAVVENAVSVENATILSSPGEPTRVAGGAVVRDSILQWGCAVTDMSIVEKSVLTEHSHVERHGKVSESILGPNSGVAEGEATACLIGPFVAFHHQALLIAAIWPEGRGNIAYGANIGSNHTSRAPDQEIWPGEGIFFGLGCDIKYPANFTRAPYSVIASGVTMLPQRVTMPFSLINPAAINVEAISPSFNEIMPGWVLYGNMYALKRNEQKYRQRDKARRTSFDFSVFRPEIIDMMVAARSELTGVKRRKQIYTQADVPGIGKNYLTERARVQAIEAYSFHIAHYAGLKLKTKLAQLTGRHLPCSDVLSRACADDPTWEHARRLIASERPGWTPRRILEDVAASQALIAQQVLDCKSKDDTRGRLTIPAYVDAHGPADLDPVVLEARREAEQVASEVSALLAVLP